MVIDEEPLRVNVKDMIIPSEFPPHKGNRTMRNTEMNNDAKIKNSTLRR